MLGDFDGGHLDTWSIETPQVSSACTRAAPPGTTNRVNTVGNLTQTQTYVDPLGNGKIFINDNDVSTPAAWVEFFTPLSQYLPGISDVNLVRPNYPVDHFYIDIKNWGSGTLKIYEIQVISPWITIDSPLTSSSTDDISLPPGAVWQIGLTYHPSDSTPKNPDEQYLFNGAGLVILSDARNSPTATVSLETAATFNSDLSYDGAVNFEDLGVLNATFGLSTGENGYNPVQDIIVDGMVNFADFGSFNADFGLALESVAGQIPEASILKQALVAATNESTRKRMPEQLLTLQTLASSETTKPGEPHFADDSDVLAEEIARRMSVAPPTIDKAEVTNTSLDYDAVFEELGSGESEVEEEGLLFDDYCEILCFGTAKSFVSLRDDGGFRL